MLREVIFGLLELYDFTLGIDDSFDKLPVLVFHFQSSKLLKTQVFVDDSFLFSEANVRHLLHFRVFEKERSSQWIFRGRRFAPLSAFCFFLNIKTGLLLAEFPDLRCNFG